MLYTSFLRRIQTRYTSISRWSAHLFEIEVEFLKRRKRKKEGEKEEKKEEKEGERRFYRLFNVSASSHVNNQDIFYSIGNEYN